MHVVLISTYELGRQPFGLASPAAWLKAAGHTVQCFDVGRAPFSRQAVEGAGLVAFHLPMHTATRLAAKLIPAVRSANPAAHLCCYGLYAPLNEGYLRRLGIETILGGEFEPALVELARRLEAGEPRAARMPDAALISLERLRFLTPDRSTLPAPERYAALRINGQRRSTGYTEASRGCKHLCRHCPVVPVYAGQFRVVQPDIVLEDIRQQAERGAEHITFGDPDFLNGPAHAVRVVERLHREFPGLTYDVTIKIEHLLQHGEVLPVLKRTGCLFVTSAVESIEEEVLRKLDKGHNKADFIRAVQACREAGLALAPTFVPFTPWTTWEGYRGLLRLLVEMGLVENVAPVQLAMRLLIPGGSRLLELPDVRETVRAFDEMALAWPWKHRDGSLDRLSSRLVRLVEEMERAGAPRRSIFRRIWEAAQDDPLPENFDLMPRATIPYMDEPWYC